MGARGGPRSPSQAAPKSEFSPLSTSRHLRFARLSFFATALYAAGEGTKAWQDLHDVTFDSLAFRFPSAQKRLLGDVERAWPVTLRRKATSEARGAANLTLYNCTFYGSEGHPQVNSGGSGVLFENNLFEWSDWSAVTTKPQAYFDPISPHISPYLPSSPQISPQAYFDPTQATSAFGKYGSGAMTIEMDRSYVPSADTK